ncbi:transcription-repair coupling factor [Aeromonas rivuli]|uniref:transcription-repair coupling factor n=1 Tax=Aeromonas rivuli TaxID=648794 RepID=UPI0005A5D9A7|nr:transcription-repair coupling factor [Aeromonas rivuli]
MRSLTLPVLPAKAGQKSTLGQLHGSALALVAAELTRSNDGPTLLVTADTPSALRLEQELRYLLSQVESDEQVCPVLLFPDWETLPYDTFSPHQDIISQRLETLYKLPQMQRGALIVPISTLMLRCAPRVYLDKYSLMVKAGQRLNLQQLRGRLAEAGYVAVEQVLEHGEFAARGSLLDLFPMGSTAPYRIDFFDDEVDSIRPFDPETQRSSEPVKSVSLLPAREFPTDEGAIELFRGQFRELFELSRADGSIYQEVSKGRWPAGIEYYLPLFFEQTASLFDYLPAQTQLITVGDIYPAAQGFWNDIGQRFEERRWDTSRPLLEPARLYLPVEQLFQALGQYGAVRLQEEPTPQGAGQINLPVEPLPELQLDNSKERPLLALEQFLQDFAGRTLFAVETEGRREVLRDLLARIGLNPPEFASLAAFLASHSEQGILVGPLERGFLLREPKLAPLAFITEGELLGGKIRSKRQRDKSKNLSSDAVIRNLGELTQGQPVVHLDHGVGRYLGLETLDAGGLPTEFLTLEYAGGDKLFVPVTNLHLISRYTGSDNPPSHKLGGEAWVKARRKAAEKVRDVAAELLDVYALRAARSGFAFKHDKENYRQFAAGFPFEETDDQLNAINAVLGDMCQAKSMDRLVCGDVGFGKTEVAMRAAFVAVHGGKQVAVLVPTTLLAQQHYDNFRDRFANWPVRVEVLSRFRSAKEQTSVLKELADGKVDIIIGTHKLLGSDLTFKDLGLLIVDEEHRFGVRQKEKIKALRADVDILTLTATPIPRTLNMAMAGMRDLSIIATPPAKRLAIKTFVRQQEPAVTREAVLRELKRGGQIYYLHNDVASIDKCANDLAELIPEARIGIAHGQMPERNLERIMSDFYHQRFNLLVCTTIIETGIDVPSANTIIMDRADHLGLAQLHQLRGRVGRSHHQAYAYLLTPPPKLMTKDAAKRLDAIASLEDLGAGFALATHDLEIRGAGELLGDDQSGQIESVGFTLYMEMLEQAVEALKSGKEPSLEQLMSDHTEVELRLPALLPEGYIPDVNMRLSMYKRIASASDEAELRELKVELIDRFGLLPDAAKTLFDIASFRQQAAALGIKRLEMSERGGYLDFNQDTRVNPGYLVKLLSEQPRVFKMDGPTRLRFQVPTQDRVTRLQRVEGLLKDLAAHSG